MSRIRDRLTPAGPPAVADIRNSQDAPPGERILVIQSAHPDRVIHALRLLAEKPCFANPKYTLFCSNRPDILEFFRGHPMLSEIRCHEGGRSAWRMFRDLRRKRYDGLVLFFSGEPGYWKSRLFAFLLAARNKLIFNENNDCFYFTWGAAAAMARHRIGQRCRAAASTWAGRMRGMLKSPSLLKPRRGKRIPADSYPGERILVLQSAEPRRVLDSFDRMRKSPLFKNPRYTLFCRDFPEVVEQFKRHPMIYEVRSHARTHNSWSHLRRLRNERFDAVVLFLTGDPGYWKIKCFAFLLGARHELIFNENNDCFFFHWRAWAQLLAHRITSRSQVPSHAGGARQAAGFFLILIKLSLFPFRFMWLLMLWGRLRWSALKASN
jgi:hypothetical protein